MFSKLFDSVNRVRKIKKWKRFSKSGSCLERGRRYLGFLGVMRIANGYMQRYNSYTDQGPATVNECIMLGAQEVELSLTYRRVSMLRCP